MTDIQEILLPRPRDKWEEDLFFSLYQSLNQLREVILNERIIKIVSETTPAGSIQNGTIWIKNSTKEAKIYVVDTWVLFASV